MIWSMWYDDLEYGIWWYEAQQKMHHLLSDSSSWTSSILFCSCSSWIEEFSVSICSMLSSNLDDRWSVKSLTTRDKFEVPSESLIPWYGMMLRDYDTGCVAMIWNEDTGWWYEMMIPAIKRSLDLSSSSFSARRRSTSFCSAIILWIDAFSSAWCSYDFDAGWWYEMMIWDDDMRWYGMMIRDDDIRWWFICVSYHIILYYRYY